jgi:tRNA pseudouridine55 synthase
MKKVIVLNKKEGETPLSALENFRKKHSEYLDVPMTYAGRLDPMASGALIILAGDEIKNKEKYLALDKEYEFSILFGFSTDTYDILGKVIEKLLGSDSCLANKVFLRLPPSQGSMGDPSPRKTSFASLEKSMAELIKKNLKYFRGKLKQKYPVYSSKTVGGKPLFSYARAGEDVEIPEREIYIKKLILAKIITINNKKLLQNIEKRIKKIKGDFRQKEILQNWKDKLKSPQKYYIVDFKIKCTSGTYVRGIANSLGKKIGIPALAFLIKRTKIGKWN